MNRSIKILHVFGRMDVGGAELRTLEVMRSVARSRFQLDFCTLAEGHGQLDDEIRDLGGRVIPVPFKRGFSARFLELLHSGKYDVVHAHVHHASGFFLRLAHRAQVPVRIAHFRSTGDGRPLTPRRRFQHILLRRWIDRHATQILAVSKAAMAAAWRPDWSQDSRCCVVYNGLAGGPPVSPADREAVRREFRAGSQTLLVVHVGNFLRDKNQRRVWSIFQELANSPLDCALAFVGGDDGSIAADVRKRVLRSSLAGRVTIAGRRSDVRQVLSAADLMLFPSLREGLPGAVLEACAQGLPVLASDLPVLKEIAPYLPSLRLEAIDSDDRTWRAAALEHAVAFAHPATKLSAIRAFQSSPFQIGITANALCRIWSRADCQPCKSTERAA
jgi:glycosyltransferase involved in cell wall biosynthesis